MKTAEEFVETIALCSWHHRKQQIESRDAEIHALYAPVVEALRELVDAIEPTPLLTQHCALRKARTALAAIKEVKGDA